MPGKRARRHFSQLREFERGLIIGMKTAGWLTCRVAGQEDRLDVPLEIVGSSGHEKAPTCGKPVTRSTTRADVGGAIVPQTISRHLAEANLKSKRSFRALPLTPEHRQLRLQWCQSRSMWNVTDWQKVVFSDESRFIWGTDDNRVPVWRCPAYDSRSTLIVMRRTLTSQRYVDDILRPHAGPFLNGLPGAILQQDNSRPHTARVAQNFLRHFRTLPWPARSPDLSPVEHAESFSLINAGSREIKIAADNKLRSSNLESHAESASKHNLLHNLTVGRKHVIRNNHYSLFGWNGTRNNSFIVYLTVKTNQLILTIIVTIPAELAFTQWQTFGLQTVESKISCFDPPPPLSPCSSYRNNYFPSFDFQATVITGVDDGNEGKEDDGNEGKQMGVGMLFVFQREIR
ncbi:transposable element Tc1 transposase [Trichonephila clavipes]|nr:transposable element Tc1 transposase [Trichonephila clavipes]